MSPRRSTPLTYIRHWRTVEFVETPLFTEQVRAIWNDEEYSEFQNYLAKHPESGRVVPGLRGLRKVRWASSGRGKRGGARVIYFFADQRSQIWLFTIYAKNRKEDLKPEEEVVMIRLLREFFDG